MPAPPTGTWYQHGVKPLGTVALPSALLGPASSAARLGIRPYWPAPAVPSQVSTAEAFDGSVSVPLVPKFWGAQRRIWPRLVPVLVVRLREPSRITSPSRAYT